MNNYHAILAQILDIIGSKAQGKGRYIDDFLDLVQVNVMKSLIQSLPEDKHKHIVDQFISTPDGSEKAENILGAYYTREQMSGALKKGTKKAIAELIVEPHKSRLTPTQLDAVLALLGKLTC